MDIFFYITWGLMSLTGGMLFGLMFTSEMEDGWKKYVIAILIALVVGFVIASAFALEEKIDVETWNNGHCEECGGSWKLINVDHIKNGGDNYYYECEECLNVICTNRHFR